MILRIGLPVIIVTHGVIHVCPVLTLVQTHWWKTSKINLGCARGVVTD